MLSLEGKQLGNYDIIRRIRVGGMGAVYEGRQRTAFDRRVAIKVILGDYAADRDMRRRFAREARTVARLHHPHILPLIEFGDEQGILYLVMPFIDGGTLTSYLRRNLPELPEIASLYQQLLDAVEYAHDEGLIHRDIKSSNVLLEMRRNAPPYVYLADFGLVRTLRKTELEQAGKPIPLDQVPGTPHYMAPEQTRGIITPLTDIYALGVLLYQMLTGELPYNDDDDIRVIQMHLHAPVPSPCERDASIPYELGEVVRKAMAKRPEARYQNVAELRRAFLAAIEGRSMVQIEETPLEEDEIETLPAPEILPPPPPRRPSVPLISMPSPDEAPAPIVMPPRRGRGGGDAILAVRERQYTTDTIQQNKRPVRITEEPLKQHRRRRITTSMFLMMAVPIILLLLILVPRVMGVSLFPAGFPLLGSPSVATVFVTAKSREIKQKYALIVSPQVKEPDLKTYAIPGRIVSSTATGNRTVSTTGTQTAPGQQAQGTIEFVNSTREEISIPAQYQLTTYNGVQIQITQPIEVPGRSNGQDGKQTVPALIAQAGANGNASAYSLNGSCCRTGVTFRNPTPFSGGTDATVLHIVQEEDINKTRDALLVELKKQAKQELQKKLANGEVLAAEPEYKVKTTPSNPVGTQIEQVQISVKVTATAPVYNRILASQTASRLLFRQAKQTLGDTYQIKGQPVIAAPVVNQVTEKGIVYLSVSTSGTWIYHLTPEQMNAWPEAIKESSLATGEAYLKTRPGVATVRIDLPFGTDRFPTNVDDIKIVLEDDGT